MGQQSPETPDEQPAEGADFRPSTRPGGDVMASRFNPPPNWPQPPKGWTPPPGWKPDPEWGPAPAGWQFWFDDAAPHGKWSWFLRHKILTGIGALVLVGVIGSALNGGREPDGAPAGLAGPVSTSTATSSTTTSSTTTAATTAVTVPPTTTSPPTSTTTTASKTSATTTTTAAKTSAPAKKSTTTKASPKPKTSTTTKKPAPKKTTTTSSVRAGVHPGAFCSPEGALGRTSTGKLMECKPSATDSRNRWRAA